MGAAFSTRRCGVCYFELPEGSKSVKRKIQRVYGLSLDHRGAEAAYEPFDAPLELTKIMDAGYAHLAISTDWPGLQESVLRGCRGCQAISELLLAAAADDEVVLNEESKMVFMWRGRASRTDPHGQFNCVGLLKVRMRVWTASPRQVPFNLAVTLGTRDIKMEDDDVEMEDPGSRVWTFTFDVDCVNAAKDKKHCEHTFLEIDDHPILYDLLTDRRLQHILLHMKIPWNSVTLDQNAPCNRLKTGSQTAYVHTSCAAESRQDSRTEFLSSPPYPTTTPCKCVWSRMWASKPRMLP